MAGTVAISFDAAGKLSRYRNMAGQSNITVNKLADWLYRAKITIDHTKIDSDLTDFVDTVVLDSGNFDFTKARSDGYDIRFTSDDGNTLLSYERVSHDNVGETAEYHIRIHSVSSSTDTIYYMYYGNAGAADGADPTAVWDANFVMVQHMNDSPDTSHIADSTANNNDGTKKGANEPVEAAGKIGKAQDFDGSNDNINLGHPASLDPGTGSFAISGWFNTSSTGSETNIISTYDPTGVRFYIEKYSNESIQFYIYDGTHYSGLTPAGWNVSDGNWHYFTLVCDKDNLKFKAALDGGAFIESTYDAFNIVFTADLYIGQWAGGYRWDGLLDEIRFSNTARSAAWNKAEYNAGNGTLHTMADDSVNIVRMLKLYAVRNMTGSSNTVFDALLTMYAIRRLTGKSDTVFDAMLAMYAIRSLGGQADIEFTPYLYLGIDGDSGLVTRY